MEAEARVGDQLYRSPCSFKVEEGDKIQVFSGRRGMRLALAIPGFISFDGDLIDSDSGRQIHDERRLNRPMSLQPGPIRFVQADEGLAGTRWVVGNELNRVGIRLSGGPQFETSAGLSEPSTPGIIQAVKDGILIHGPDGPTIGGYRRLGCVIGVDLDRLAQLRPEQTVEFNPVSLSKARSLLHKHDETLSRVGSLIGLLDQAAERTRSRRWNQ
jgi:allophanate hydrolase subunit 2